MPAIAQKKYLSQALPAPMYQSFGLSVAAQTLGKLLKRQNAAVFCTVTPVFQLFDQMLFAGGRALPDYSQFLTQGVGFVQYRACMDDSA